MFRRSTKLTALLVAAASVASMTPVMAAEKLNQKDATVKEGVAYDGGKYAYYGYRTDEDDTAIYYNNGSDSKDKKMDDDLDDYEITGKSIKYGTKYLYVKEDGNKDEYLIDLSTGKVVDDETAESKQNSAQSKLISKLKKTERYNQTSDKEYGISDENTRSNRLFKNQFGDVWYQYVVATTDADIKDEVLNPFENVDNNAYAATTAAGVGFGQEGTGLYTGFFDENGKYVDACHIANIKVYNPRKEKASVIEKFDKVYKDEALKLELKALKPLTQDKDNIYAIAAVDVYYYQCDENGKYIFEDDDQYDANKKARVITQYFIQKISKAQGEKEDEAYVPKSVESWQIDNSSDKADYVKDYTGALENDSEINMFIGGKIKGNGDRKDAYNELVKPMLNSHDEYLFDDKDDDDDKYLYSVKGNYLYATRRDGDDAKVFKLKLGTDKIKMNGEKLAEDKEGNKYRLSKDYLKEENDGTKRINISKMEDIKDDEIDTKVVYKDSDAGTDCDGGEEFTLDVDGNPWCIHNGKIKMYDGDGWKDMYSCDRSYDKLDVYDKNSLLAWNDEKDSYTTVKEGKAQTVSDAKEIDSTLTSGATNGTTTTAKTGWEKQADGTWVLYDATGNKTTGWANVGGVWYYMDAAGIMKTGWVNDNGTWYYCNASGAMQTGWLQDNGTWYYLQSNGAMKTGWLNDNGTWYYLKSNGAMAANETIDGYYVNASGAWVK